LTEAITNKFSETAPEDIHQTYLVGSKINGANFLFAWSTKQLLELIASQQFMQVDATYKIVFTSFPILVFIFVRNLVRNLFDAATEAQLFGAGAGLEQGRALIKVRDKDLYLMSSGNKEFIKKARRFRKLFGGGMRQIGVLAACSAYALTHHFPLLPRVHALARKLEQGLEAIGAEITSRAETCMVGV